MILQLKSLDWERQFLQKASVTSSIQSEKQEKPTNQVRLSEEISKLHHVIELIRKNVNVRIEEFENPFRKERNELYTKVNFLIFENSKLKVLCYLQTEKNMSGGIFQFFPKVRKLCEYFPTYLFKYKKIIHHLKAYKVVILNF